MKQCSRCHQTFVLALFGKNRARHDGLSDSCRACRVFIAAAAYQQRLAKNRAAKALA